MEYEELKEFDNDRTNEDLIKKVRKLLYNFSYCDLSDIYPNKGECQKIRKSIINFLYSAKFTLDNDSDINPSAELKLKNAIFKNFNKALESLKKIKKNRVVNDRIKEINKLKLDLEHSFDFNGDFYDNYIEIWKKINLEHVNFIKNLDLVNYILIYEAPPFSNDANNYLEKNYFLTSNKGNYATSLKTCFNSKKMTVKDVLITNNVAYFDLIMGCLPIADEKKDDLRDKWCYNKDFKIGEKALPVVLLELGIYYILTNINQIIKFPKIALGAPIKTSRAIFEYYSDNPMKVLLPNNKLSDFLDLNKRKNIDMFDYIFLPAINKLIDKNYTEILSIEISNPNSINGFKKLKKGVILPLHKANIVSAANSPNGELLKNAYDNY
jgi:hypothetical protein